MSQIAARPGFIANYESAGIVAHYLGTDETWDFFMDVEENMIPRFVEWLDDYEAR